MKRQNPERFAVALELERNANLRRKGSYLPMFGSLEMIASQDELPGFDEAIEMEGGCSSGSCFV